MQCYSCNRSLNNIFKAVSLLTKLFKRLHMMLCVTVTVAGMLRQYHYAVLCGRHKCIQLHYSTPWLHWTCANPRCWRWRLSRLSADLRSAGGSWASEQVTGHLLSRYHHGSYSAWKIFESDWILFINFKALESAWKHGRSLKVLEKSLNFELQCLKNSFSLQTLDD